MTSLPPSRYFPPAELADGDGLICVGGDLTHERLLDAYQHGIFPWPIEPYGPMLWWSPDPRAIIELDQFHVARRLRRICRSGRFRITCNQCFTDVIRGCSVAQDRRGETWLTDEMIDAYVRLHESGAAHSVEAWHEEQLAGGVYGLALGGMFAAESMYYAVRDASKVALVYLVAHLSARGYRLLDIQQLTSHTRRMGASEIPRREYLDRLSAALAVPITFGSHLEGSEHILNPKS